MKMLFLAALALTIPAAGFAQTTMDAPASPPNSSTPTGATTNGGPADSGSGMGSMDNEASNVPMPPTSSDRGGKPHSKIRKNKPTDATMPASPMSGAPSGTAPQ